MGVETLAIAGAGALYGAYSANKNKQNANDRNNNIRKLNEQYQRDFDVNTSASEKRFRQQLESFTVDANKRLSTSTASEVAQVSAGAAARGSQSGISGANTEALISENTRGIYKEAANIKDQINTQRLTGEQRILDFLASRDEQRLNFVYSSGQQEIQGQYEADSIDPIDGAINGALGGIQVASNIKKAQAVTGTTDAKEPSFMDDVTNFFKGGAPDPTKDAGGTTLPEFAPIPEVPLVDSSHPAHSGLEPNDITKLNNSIKDLGALFHFNNYSQEHKVYAGAN